MDLIQLAHDISIPPLTSATEYAQQVLRAAILRGLLPAGQPLRQEELAAQLGVSRLPVREALFKLQAEGLVTLHRNRGAVVAEMSAAEAQELCEIRCALEPLALRLAFPRLTEADLSTAEKTLALTDTQPNVADWGEANWEFHRTLYQPSGRTRLLDLLGTLHLNVDRYLRFELSALSYKERSQSEHRAILDACRQREMDEAVRLLEDHIRVAGDQLVEHLGGGR